jgi:hypothetical protein
MNTEMRGPPLMLRLIRTWRRRKSSFNLGDTRSMPMWLGANNAPMYRPNTASCAARNATAFPRGHEEHQSDQSAQSEGEQAELDPAPLNLVPADDPADPVGEERDA